MAKEAELDQASMPDLDKLKRYFSESRDLTTEARNRSLKAIDYYDSDQYTISEVAALQKRKQPPIVINRVKKAVNGIIGVTEKGRSEPRCWPRNPDDEDSADAATDILRYIADFNKFKRLKQDCFLDLLVPGTMAALVGVDPDKQVTITQIRWEEFFGDPRSRRKDWKDARYLGVAKWMYADDAAAMYPDKREQIDASIEAGGLGGISPDESFQDRPLQGSGNGTVWVDRKQRRLMVVEIYYRDGGWKRCVFTATDVLECGDSPYQDHKGRPDCPIEASSLYVKRDNARYGEVWDMIGPQDEVNKRRSKALHLLATSRIEAIDGMAANVDADRARMEAARPDGVLPVGWRMAPNTAEFQGHMEMLAEAKGEIERMGPSPAMLGRNEHDDSGRALLARQQSGLVELANVYGALEDWELRIYRQSWGRAKQFWTEPQFIRVTDDENAPKFVGLNQPIADPSSAGAAGVSPQNGNPARSPNILGYKNVVGEMDVDIEIDTTVDMGTVRAEQFNEILAIIKLSPVYQQQINLKQIIQLSEIPHKRSILEGLDEAAQQQAQAAAQQQQIAMAGAQAKVADLQASAAEKAAKVPLHGATGFAKTLDALTYSHAAHSDHIAAGLEQGIAHEQGQQAQQATVEAQARDQAAGQQTQQADQAHQAAMQDSQQEAAANMAQTDQGKE